MSETQAGLRSQTIVVTGSTGFIGRALCVALLEAGHKVHGTDIRADPTPPPGLKFAQLDILDAAAIDGLMQGAQPEIVVHLAARTDLVGETLDDYRVNYDGVRHVIDAATAIERCERILVASSQLVFAVSHRPQSTYDYNPNTVYGYSKVGTELTARHAAPGKVLILLRPTTIWGEGMSDHYRRILQLLNKGVFFHAGSEDRYKSYGYIGNIVHQLTKLMQAPALAVDRKMFYLADYEPISLRKWVDALAAAQGSRNPVTLPLPLARLLAWSGDLIGLVRPFPFNSFRLRNMRAEYVFDLDATRAVCGPGPYSFDEAVERTVAWHEAKERAHPE